MIHAASPWEFALRATLMDTATPSPITRNRYALCLRIEPTFRLEPPVGQQQEKCHRARVAARACVAAESPPIGCRDACKLTEPLRARVDGFWATTPPRDIKSSAVRPATSASLQPCSALNSHGP